MEVEVWDLGRGEPSGVSSLPLFPPPWDLLKKEQQGTAKLTPLIGPVQMWLI